MTDWENVAKFLSNKVIAKSSVEENCIDLIKEFDLTDDELKEIGFDEEYIRGARDEIENDTYEQRTKEYKRRVDDAFHKINKTVSSIHNDIFTFDEKTAKACENLKTKFAVMVAGMRSELFGDEEEEDKRE